MRCTHVHVLTHINCICPPPPGAREKSLREGRGQRTPGEDNPDFILVTCYSVTLTLTLTHPG